MDTHLKWSSSNIWKRMARNVRPNIMSDIFIWQSLNSPHSIKTSTPQIASILELEKHLNENIGHKSRDRQVERPKFASERSLTISPLAIVFRELKAALMGLTETSVCRQMMENVLFVDKKKEREPSD